MRVGSLVALVVLLSPAVSFAQSAIAGLVTDATGAVLPGVTVEARSPALIEQDAHGDVRRQRPVPSRGPAARHLQRDISRCPASARSSAKASCSSRLHGDDQRPDEGRRPRGDGHRIWRVAGRRRAEHDEPHGALEGTDGSAAVGPKLPEPGRHDSCARLGASPGGSTSAARRRCGREPSWLMDRSPATWRSRSTA